MQIFNISDFKLGWFIGDFEPNVLRTKDFEIAHHTYPKDFKSEPHYHKVATEINYIVRGSLMMATGGGWMELKRGDGFIFRPGEFYSVEYLEETDLIVIKAPSVIGDKYLIDLIDNVKWT